MGGSGRDGGLGRMGRVRYEWGGSGTNGGSGTDVEDQGQIGGSGTDGEGQGRVGGGQGRMGRVRDEWGGSGTDGGSGTVGDARLAVIRPLWEEERCRLYEIQLGSTDTGKPLSWHRVKILPLFRITDY